MPSAVTPLSTRPPLRELWQHASHHRPKVVLATVLSVANKICDVAPELLIGVAVDVVVNLTVPAAHAAGHRRRHGRRHAARSGLSP